MDHFHKHTTYQQLREGQTVRVTYEGTVDEIRGGQKVLRLADGSSLPSVTLRRATNMMLAVPKWQIGDVVVIRFNGPGSTPYTYVRDASRWPGVTTNLSDEDVTRYVEAGVATHLVRAGEVVPQKAKPVASLPSTLRPRPFPF